LPAFQKSVRRRQTPPGSSTAFAQVAEEFPHHQNIGFLWRAALDEDGHYSFAAPL
jgi:hypothetical protein